MPGPHISQREYIKWQDEAATEPTSTLVLTAFNNKFIDIRIFHPKSSDEPELPNQGGPLSRLEWGFAGTSRSMTLGTAQDPVNHSVWEHWVDSQVALEATPPVDEGDLFDQADGRCLETGKMVNPLTGQLSNYEEMWLDLPIETTGTDDKKWSVVMSLDSPQESARGMVVRVGQWCQVILKVNDIIEVERWRYAVKATTNNNSGIGDDSSSNSTVSDGGWIRLVKIGNGVLPCTATFSPGDLSTERVITIGAFTWTVEEVHCWD